MVKVDVFPEEVLKYLFFGLQNKLISLLGEKCFKLLKLWLKIRIDFLYGKNGTSQFLYYVTTDGLNMF